MSLRLAATLGLLLCVAALALAEPRVQPKRGLDLQDEQALQHPYLFLTVPRGRSGASVQGFELIAEPDDVDDDDDDDHEDGNGKQMTDDLNDEDESMDDDDEDDDDSNVEDDDDTDADVDAEDDTDNVQSVKNADVVLKNAKATHMMVSREHAGALLVPDGFIEIEGQSVIDPETGKTALLVPKSSLDAVPDGSVVALMERPEGMARAAMSDEERANRVIVRRRRKGARRNVRRRGGKRRGGNRRRRRGGNRNKRRRGNRRRPNVRVIKSGNRRRNGNRRRTNNRRRVVMQG